ncbi:T-complex protein 1, eta subunit [Phytophthora cinnamomi]|uniref:T-complex protein 1, eta subunit n=1 Tax=Phytophthora cinnamomi TaxID=4785 RepID=UPI00355A5FBE|nr:T-complex protein 1, eta subunit [Phytophthora cinnamomi]
MSVPSRSVGVSPLLHVAVFGSVTPPSVNVLVDVMLLLPAASGLLTPLWPREGSGTNGLDGGSIELAAATEGRVHPRERRSRVQRQYHKRRRVAWTAPSGTSGSLSLASGDASKASSGSVRLTTFAATGGGGGNIELSVGGGDTGAVAVAVVGSTGGNGGSVLVCMGDGWQWRLAGRSHRTAGWTETTVEECRLKTEEEEKEEEEEEEKEKEKEKEEEEEEKEKEKEEEEEEEEEEKEEEEEETALPEPRRRSLAPPPPPRRTMNGMMPQIILLKEGTDTSQGKAQLISNINACQAVMEAVRTTLGPRGMDKLIHTGGKTTISNDGATIMNLLDVVHPAAKTLVDISLSQDAEVGDGTTSVVLLGAEFMRQAKPFVEENMHPQMIIKSFRKAGQLAVQKIKDIEIRVADSDEVGRRQMLERVSGTALNSKLISRHKQFFSPMIVDAVLSLDEGLDISMVGVKKVPGGSVTDSFLVKGVAFKKTFSYAGFEQQPKTFVNPKILLLNVELELKSEKENAEVRLDDPTKYQSIVDAEWNIIYEKLELCVKSGAQIILSKLPVGDLATQYFADRGLFCAGRVAQDDMERTQRATGGVVQTSVHDMNPSVLGSCGRFEERQVGNERYNIFMECAEAKSSTIVLRGGAEQFIEEAHRSVHDALMVVKRAVASSTVVAGGGAIEMEISRHLRQYARTIEGKAQLLVNAYAKAFEIIPRQIAENAGHDATDILNRLRQKHFKDPEEGKWFGVDITTGGICDTYESHVWEPAANKINSIAAATEAACLILSVDETVRNPKSEQPQAGPAGGAPMSAAMGGQGMRGMMGGGRGGPSGMGRGVRAFRGKGGA